ncbi:putative aspartate tyrosine aromatic aminotransferase [Phaeomoniella chlamydospora]|uniref:Putative aspartate tyrosine aromatic aminotransferase n=1 Tax=Phaeomoniella chlamydospora TaxID=158046 RepID=A0A0G2ESJ0_PHACM|nr:putative aspartate tyrosine aromatic aminotransferase [Phaeomoniella chlamydospora]
MVLVSTFEVEAWMDKHEEYAKYNVAETCAASISVDDLVALADSPLENPLQSKTKLTYGSIRGSQQLRSNLAGLYSAKSTHLLSPENVLITPGAIAANFLALYTFVNPGDHVICHYPTYEQLYKVPAALGAEVSLWKSDESKGWALSIDELEQLVQPGKTKLLIINNPQNPTGAVIPKDTLYDMVNLCRLHSITILSDEVYRPLFHGITPMDKAFPPSAINLGYDNVVVTGSMSKAYSLAGIRLGWIASKNDQIIEKLAEARHYTNISVSQIDDAVAATALSENCIHALLGRNIQLAKSNLQLLDEFVESHRWACSWTKPVAGTTAFVKFSKMGKAIDDVAFCEALMEKKGVLFAPGCKCFGQGEDFKGYVRIGFVQEAQVLSEGLQALREFMEDDYEMIPTVKKPKV